MHNKECPKCEIPWEEQETIYEFFLNKYSDETKARETAGHYGCTVETPKHFSKNVVGIEIQGMYDGVSYWKCQSCETVFNRWTMQETEINYGED